MMMMMMTTMMKGEGESKVVTVQRNLRPALFRERRNCVSEIDIRRGRDITVDAFSLGIIMPCDGRYRISIREWERENWGEKIVVMGGGDVYRN